MTTIHVSRVLLALIIVTTNVVLAGEIKLLNKFETWNGAIGSTDPAGICYNPNSGHLFIADSEIEEIAAIWNCQNIFEVTLGGKFIAGYDSYDDDAQPCFKSGSITKAIGREPAGITFNEYDGYFYVADDEEHAIIRYNDSFGPPQAWLNILDFDSNGIKPDLEGITSDPETGYLYVLLDTQREVRVFKSDLDPNPVSGFSLEGIARHPEGIAYHKQFKHLFIISSRDNYIYEMTPDGVYLDEYDISDFLPEVTDAEGLTFAPSSDPDDEPQKLSLYISDTQEDNDFNPLERDGIIYETEITSDIVSIDDPEFNLNSYQLHQNYPNPFNPLTRIPFNLAESGFVNLMIFNMNGELISTLVSGYMVSGSHQVIWDGKNEHGLSVSSGIYIYKIQTDKFSQSRKMIFVK